MREVVVGGGLGVRTTTARLHRPGVVGELDEDAVADLGGFFDDTKNMVVSGRGSRPSNR